MTADILRESARLSEQGEPFVLATVLWRQAPSSGKVGAKALVRADGTVQGWVGGACAEPTVVREALAALRDGQPRLLFLGPERDLANRSREGVVTVPIACQSDGALELHLEPVMAAPHLVVIGHSPAVDALLAMANALGWATVAVDDRAEGSPAGRVVAALDLAEAGVHEGSFVVVATQGHYDEDAMEAALATPAAYVGLVASRRRAETVRGYLRDRGFDAERLDRIQAPAGLDLGRTSHTEIAVSILAELVRLRASGGVPARAITDRGGASDDAEAIDPVCGMTVRVADARHHATHDGETFWFCCPGCRAAFLASPEEHLQDA